MKAKLGNLFELPKDKKAIGVKWVFRKKINPDGLVYMAVRVVKF